MNIQDYLDATYLMTPEEAGISESETKRKVLDLTDEAIENGYYLVMVRPQYVKDVKNRINSQNASTKVGTVISFPLGNSSTEAKLQEAESAIKDGADELDFVINYKTYQSGNVQGVADEVRKCTEYVIDSGLTIKWIIETAALTNEQVQKITSLIRSVAENEFSDNLDKIFIKTSTGYYVTPDDSPSGATVDKIKIIKENAGDLPIKASGGIKTREDADKFIDLGVKRLGTSSSRKIMNG